MSVGQEAPDQGRAEGAPGERAEDFSLDAPTTKATSADVVIVFAKNEAELDRRAAPAIEAADRRGRS
jgi:hypothetical protein